MIGRLLVGGIVVLGAAVVAVGAAVMWATATIFDDHAEW